MGVSDPGIRYRVHALMTCVTEVGPCSHHGFTNRRARLQSRRALFGTIRLIEM